MLHNVHGKISGLQHCNVYQRWDIQLILSAFASEREGYVGFHKKKKEKSLKTQSSIIQNENT